MQLIRVKNQEGLGDTIESVLKVTGIHYIANAIANGNPTESCKACNKRKEELNKSFPYGTR